MSEETSRTTATAPGAPLPDGAVALVTGAGRGIGRASALAFARAGARLALFGRTRTALDQTADAARELGCEPLIGSGDVAKEADMAGLVSAIEQQFGRLDCVFNNAGVEGRFGPLTDLDNATFTTVFDVNTRGVWLSLKHQVPLLRATGGGTIVNMSSDIATLGVPHTGLYTASKAAVDALTRCAAMENARDNIRVNAVGPGVVEDSGMTERLWSAEQLAGHRERSPTGRLTTPDEIATTVLWLSSTAASHINGQILNIDGGLALR